MYKVCFRRRGRIRTRYECAWTIGPRSRLKHNERKWYIKSHKSRFSFHLEFETIHLPFAKQCMVCLYANGRCTHRHTTRLGWTCLPYSVLGTSWQVNHASGLTALVILYRCKGFMSKKPSVRATVWPGNLI